MNAIEVTNILLGEGRAGRWSPSAVDAGGGAVDRPVGAVRTGGSVRQHGDFGQIGERGKVVAGVESAGSGSPGALSTADGEPVRGETQPRGNDTNKGPRQNRNRAGCLAHW